MCSPSFCSYFITCFSAGDDKWLLVSTDQLYGMTQNSTTHSRRYHKPRITPVSSSTAALETTQCEVAFPGNRILSPSPVEGDQSKPDCLLDASRTDANSDLTSEHLLSPDNHISDKVSTPLVSQLHNANTSTANSNSSDSQLSDKYKIADSTRVKRADSCGIYVENGDHNAVPLEPLKAEKLATFGNDTIGIIHIIVYLLVHLVYAIPTVGL